MYRLYIRYLRWRAVAQLEISKGRVYSPKVLYWETLREKCPNMDFFFLVRIFPYSDWIRKDALYLSVFSPNTGKYGPEKTSYLDTFHAVRCFRNEGKFHKFKTKILVLDRGSFLLLHSPHLFACLKMCCCHLIVFLVNYCPSIQALITEKIRKSYFACWYISPYMKKTYRWIS